MSEVIDISLQAILIPACASSSLAFCMIYSTCKLNKKGDGIQPWCIPFTIWNLSVVPCPVLTVVSWPAYRFLRSQVRWSGIPISWRILHSLLWSTRSKPLKFNEADVDVFLVFSSFFNDATHVGYLIAGYSAFSKASLNTQKFMDHILKAGMENFEHYFNNMLYECHCAVVEHS